MSDYDKPLTAAELAETQANLKKLRDAHAKNPQAVDAALKDLFTPRGDQSKSGDLNK